MKHQDVIRTARWRTQTLFLIVAGMGALTGPALAQNTNAGEIRGTVTDASGAVMPAVTVSILNAQNGVRQEMLTNAAGIYDALSLVPGKYTITFSKDGFSRLVRGGIELQVEVITVNGQMAVGTASQQVEVSARAEMLRTENGEQGTTLQAQTVKELPNIGQTWLNFTNTLPGVSGSGAAISVNGTERYEGNFLADGGLVILPRSNNLDSAVIFESVAEVKISTASFDAQYGSGTAVFNQITKSGTNAFHGAAYDYAQHDALNARSFFSTTVPHSRRHQYGASIGGPVRKDKLFFYGNWDSTFSHTAAATYVTYPQAAARAGDFSSSAFPLIYDPLSLAPVNGVQVRTPFPGNRIPVGSLDPVALNIQKFFPTPNIAGTLVNDYYYAKLSKSHPNAFLGKADYQISSANRLSVSVMRRLSLTTPDPTTSATYPMDSNSAISRGLQAQVTDVWIASPSIVNEFRMAAIRQLIRDAPPSLGQGYPAQLGIKYALADLFPTVSIGGPVGGASIGPGTSAVIGEVSYVPSDTLTIVRGRHILKVGGQYEANSDNGGNFGDVSAASFTFNPVFTARAPFDSKSGLGYADFLTGQISSWNAFISPVIGLRMKTGQLFAQDDFKIKPNLTLNLGVRYEIQGGWSEVSNRLAVFDPAIANPTTKTLGGMWWGGDNGRRTLQANIYNTVLPRAGFAWSPGSKWSVRGGFGVFTHRWGTDVYANPAARIASYFTTGTLTETDAIHPVFRLSDPNPSLNIFYPDPSRRTPDSLNGQPVFYYPYHTPASKVYEWSFGVQRELGKGTVAEVSYVGNTGIHLSSQRDFNQVPEKLLGVGSAQLQRPYPQFQTITADLFDNRSNYHGLQATFRTQVSRDLTLNMNYTWSKNLAYEDASGWAGQAGTADWQRAHDIAANYGPSNNDVPQMFKAYFVYQLPFGPGRAMANSGGLLGALIGGWQTSGIFIHDSGTPFNPVMGTANLSGALSGSWYPNRVGNGTLSNPTIAQWFDTSAFVQPAAFTFGNSGRNILRGPGMTTLDYSMGKNFGLSRVHESMQLQVRLDAMNIMNHPVFSNPNARIGAAGVGTITSTLVGGRTIQLGARLAF